MESNGSVFGLSADKHIAFLFPLRASWALSYVRSYFLARIETTAYSKLVDAFLKGIFSAQTCLCSFFNQVGISAFLQNLSLQDMQCIHLKTCIPIEEHARSIFTPFAFKALQHELLLAMQYAASEMANGSYNVHHFKQVDGERLVIWIPENEQINCSCREFESSGILCRHAIHVFVVKNYFQLPNKYYISRWQKVSTYLLDYHNNQNIDDEWFKEYQSLAETLFAESSITKERSDYACRELPKEATRILNEVRNMAETDVLDIDITFMPT